MDENKFEQGSVTESHLVQPSPKQGVLWCFGFLLLILFSSVLYVLLYMGFNNMGAESISAPVIQEHLTSLNGIVGVYLLQFCFILPVILSISNFKEQSWHQTLAIHTTSLKVLLVWAGIWLAYQIIAVAVSTIIETPIDEFILQMQGRQHLGITVTVVILAPIFEELIFRGYLFKAWRHSWLGFSGTLVITSVLFTLMHLGQYNWLVLIQLFAFAMILGIAREKTGTLLVPIFIHALNNLFSIIVISYLGIV